MLNNIYYICIYFFKLIKMYKNIFRTILQHIASLLDVQGEYNKVETTLYSVQCTQISAVHPAKLV